jgi:hypothetical protein
LLVAVTLKGIKKFIENIEKTEKEYTRKNVVQEINNSFKSQINLSKQT